MQGGFEQASETVLVSTASDAAQNQRSRWTFADGLLGLAVEER